MELEEFINFRKDISTLNAFNNFMNFQCLTSSINIEKTIARRLQPRPKFNPLLDLDEREFHKRYRFDKENMRRIIEILRDDLELEATCTKTNQVPVELQIMAALRFWGRTEHPEATSQIHHVAPHTLQKICRRVGHSLAAKASRYIRMPVTLAEKERVICAFQTLAGMPQVLGAVAHTSMHTRQQGVKKKYIIIQIVADASYKIRDVVCKLAAHGDAVTCSSVFKRTRIKERFEGNEFRGRLLLGNEWLQGTSFLLKPLTCAVSEQDQAFNRSHSTTYAPVKKCLDLLKRRFGILHSEWNRTSDIARQTVIALSLLHNLAIEWKDDCLDF